MDTLNELMSNPKFIATMGVGIVVLTIILPQYIRGRHVQPYKKRMRRKVKATVTESYTDRYYRDRDEIWVTYTFSVDGKEYTGSGAYNHAEYELFRKVTVYYNPENPFENCTSLERINMGTSGAAFIFWVLVGLLVLTYLFAE